MSLLDFNGREIKVGDIVTHAYEPIPPDANWSPGGYHHHYFSGTAEVIEINRTTLALLRTVGGPDVRLASLCQVIDPAGGGGHMPCRSPVPTVNRH
ncbi:conserved protein of unknown function [Magnetospirillum sp. XM-1]|uniref:hypothetical protein n=1 Tax=Magnetospirillum sp. XM-1 TaxID=1663591 RepID=UPI00073E012B|nr:hypothetical protein [Magnetospirillum sp. XM-1]CUW41110.1 conserved protein of unknown function [Magnetospirillum sp. XM-1]